MKLKVSPLAIFLIALIIGTGAGGTGGYLIGRNSIETTKYDVEISYSDIETSVDANNQVETSVNNKTQVITEINEYEIGTNSIWTHTNYVTNFMSVTNTNYSSHGITNSYSNLFDYSDIPITNRREVLSNIIHSIQEETNE